MAGDHRCPVCQSTFTRPQHVARHMRSHTGDRPYKCQICGDQFARSDLLSRHVNKCHAADKPANSTSRRRGSSNQAAAATARAAIEAAQQQPPVLSQCDQCKHAGLACDLRSPCTTCHQRRISCTYPRVRSSNRKPDLAFSGSAVYPPPNMTVPSLLPASSNLYSGSISDSGVSNYSNTFYLPNSASDMNNRSSSSLSLHSNPTGSLPDHNLLNMFPQYATGASSSTVPTGAQPTDPSVSLLPPPGSAPASQTNFGGWNANGSASGLPNDFQSLAHNMNQPRPSSLVTDFMFDLPDSRPSTGTSLPSPRSLIDMSQPPVDIYGYRRSDQHSQSGTESDFSNSSSPAVGRNGFATGGNPLLPMNNDIFAHQPVGLDGQLQQRSENSNPFAFDVSQQQGTGRNEVVSSAFGLLSLEEAMRNNNQAAAQFSFHPPPVPGQPSTDMGAWSRPGSQAGRPGTSGSSASAPADTSIVPPGGLPAISPATEAREMREFWKNFMCDPYATGDTPNAETPGAVRTPHGSRPGFLRGLSKSASLPPIRRQSFTSGVNDRHAYDDSTPHASMAQQLGHAVNTAAPPKSIINPTDLRSYEEAIRARPPPVLKFEPRSRNGQDLHARGAGAGDLSGNEQMNGSDSSRRGSIAGIPDTSPIPSIRRIVPAAGTSSAAAAYSSSDDGSSRPSFKRLASQTLGPSYSKKAQHHRLGDPDAADSPTTSGASDAPGDDDDSESSEDRGMPNGHRRPRGMRSSRRSHNSGMSGVLAADRRMSIPATGA